MATSKIKILKDALDFLDKCRADPKAMEVGAFVDAFDWLESAARDVVKAEVIPNPNNQNLLNRLFTAQVGGCSCMTKTPNLEHHQPWCHYKLHEESRREIARLSGIDVY